MMTTPKRGMLFGSVLLVTSAATIGILSSVAPLAAALLVVTPLCFWLFISRPEWAVAAVVISSLAKDVPLSGLLIVLGSVTAVLGLLLRFLREHRVPQLTFSLGVVALVPLVLGLRLMAEGTREGGVGGFMLPEWAIFFANAVVALAAGILSLERRPAMEHALGALSLLFLIAFLPAAMAGETGRMYALTGNPNRTVFALAITAPFALKFLYAARPRITFLPTYIAVAYVLFLVAKTGSAQGIVAIPIVIAVTFFAIRSGSVKRKGRSTRFLFGLAALGGSLWVLTLAVGDRFAQRASNLSGRLEFFGYAVDDFWNNWLLGTGQRVVSEGFVEVSAHNTYLGVMATGGVLAALLLLFALLAAMRNVPGLLRARSVAPAALAGLLIEFIVQAADGVPATWAILSLAVARPMAELTQANQSGRSRRGGIAGEAVRINQGQNI